MGTASKPRKRRQGSSTGSAPSPRRRSPVHLFEEAPLAISRSISLDTLAKTIPSRPRLAPISGPRPKAHIRIDLPEGTVVRLIVVNDEGELVDTLLDGWVPAGTHDLCDLCLPNGAYKLRLETPNAWHVAGIMIG